MAYNSTSAQLSAFNGFIPSATGQAISYIRNPDEFQVNNYVQYLEAPETQGYYAVIDRDTPARVVTDEEYDFEDGAERPVTPYNGLFFAWQNFRTKRRNVGTVLGDQAVEMAQDAWKALEHHIGAISQIAITLRTWRVIQLLEATGNWNGNTADANVLNNGAGNWTTSSDDPNNTNYNAIKRSLIEAVRRILISSRGFVRARDLVLLVSPGLAQAMANTGEIHNYLRNSGPFSLGVLEGKEPNLNEDWGIPKILYGIPVIVEDAVRVTDRPTAAGGVGTGASSNASTIKADTSAVLMSRKGGIDGQYGSPSFSTLQVYWFQYLMSIFAWHEPRNARTLVDATEQYIEVLAAPESGFLITNTA